jgi:hypothetical protein
MPLHSHRLQPQSSATRDIELQYDKVDAEASSILIALANHNRKEQHASEMAAAAAMKSLAAATGQDLSCASFLAVCIYPYLFTFCISMEPKVRLYLFFLFRLQSGLSRCWIRELYQTAVLLVRLNYGHIFGVFSGPITHFPFLCR